MGLSMPLNCSLWHRRGPRDDSPYVGSSPTCATRAIVLIALHGQKGRYCMARETKAEVLAERDALRAEVAKLKANAAGFTWEPVYVRAFPGQSEKVLVNVGAILKVGPHKVALVKMAKAGTSKRGPWAFGASTKYKVGEAEKTFDVVELRPDFATKLAIRALEALDCDQAKDEYPVRYRRGN